MIGIFGCVVKRGGSFTKLASCELYDASQDRWYRLPDMREKRGGPAAASVPGDSRVFIFGGAGDSFKLASVEFCHLRAGWQKETGSEETRDFWMPAASMRSARSSLAAAQFRGRIIVAGGRDGVGAVNTVELFTLPDTTCPLGQWTELAAMEQPRAWFTILTSTDSILAFGGNTEDRGTVETLTAPENSVDFGSDLTAWKWSSLRPVGTLDEITGAATIHMTASDLDRSNDFLSSYVLVPRV